MKPKMYSFLVDNNSDHEKARGVNRKVAATISQNVYKDILLNNKSWRRSMYKIRSKDHRIGNYEINKISFSCFVEKIYIQNNEYDALALRY